MNQDVVVAEEDLIVRRLRDDDADYDRIAKWRSLPHVHRWWDPDLPAPTTESVREEYRPDTAPDGLTKACIIERRHVAIGFIQFYKWISYADEAKEVGIPFDDRSYGLDIFIGDPNEIGKGVGTRVVRLLSDYLIRELDASSVALTTDLANRVAQRCYEKAGFRRVKEVLDTDTYKGERVRCWQMVKEPN